MFCLKVQMAERTSEVMELKRNLAQALRDKERLLEVKQQRSVLYTKTRQAIALAFWLRVAQQEVIPSFNFYFLRETIFRFR